MKDLGLDIADPSVRYYQTNRRLEYHTDSIDIVGLLCLKTARAGGESFIVSSCTIYNEILARRPDLVPALFEPFATDRRGEVPEGMKPWFDIPVYHWHAGRLTCIYVRQYIESAQRNFPAARRLTRGAVRGDGPDGRDRERSGDPPRDGVRARATCSSCTTTRSCTRATTSRTGPSPSATGTCCACGSRRRGRGRCPRCSRRATAASFPASAAASSCRGPRSRCRSRRSSEAARHLGLRDRRRRHRRLRAREPALRRSRRQGAAARGRRQGRLDLDPHPGRLSLLHRQPAHRLVLPDRARPGAQRPLASCYARGKVLGGCSSINAMLYLRGQARDYDEWARIAGDARWSWASVLPVFKRSEDHHARRERHARRPAASGGSSGSGCRGTILDAFREAAAQAGMPKVDDFNRGDNEGAAFFEVNQSRGVRWSAAKGFLRPAMDRPNLTVMTDVHVKPARGSKASARPASSSGAAARTRSPRRGSRRSSPRARSARRRSSSSRASGRARCCRSTASRSCTSSAGVGENLQDHLQLRMAFKVKNVRDAEPARQQPAGARRRWGSSTRSSAPGR